MKSKLGVLCVGIVLGAIIATGVWGFVAHRMYVANRFAWTESFKYTVGEITDVLKNTVMSCNVVRFKTHDATTTVVGGHSSNELYKGGYVSLTLNNGYVIFKKVASWGLRYSAPVGMVPDNKHKVATACSESGRKRGMEG